MAEYQVKVGIRVPKSRNPQSGKVTYQPSGYGATTVKVNASSPEEARKLATKSEKVTKARTQAAKNLDYDMPKPRVQIQEVKRTGSSSRLSGRGGGGGGILTPDGNSSGLKGLPKGMTRKMNKGGVAKKKK